MVDEDLPLVTLQIRLRRQTIERMDALRRKHPMRPSRAQVIRALLEQALNAKEESRNGERS